MIAFLFGAFGLLLGSFLNVMILRHGAKAVTGRSNCLSCGRQLHSSDMIPVLSWILLRGRCRFCKSKISIQYPLVEATTGMLFALVAIAYLPHFGFWANPLPAIILLTPYLAIAALLIAIAVYDLRHTIIPDGWVYLFDALALITVAIYPIEPATLPLLMLAGPIAAFPLFVFWFISRGRWMGFGDVKLALGIGWLLGPLHGIFAIFLGFVIGAIVTVPLLVISSLSAQRISKGFTPTRAFRKLPRGFTMKSEIPFGPFLIFSCIIVWLLCIYGVDPLSTLGLLP
jgi:leader peptidase (prepilin peptidase)/N-methyltransferase